jgi:hypothetical protein
LSLHLHLLLLLLLLLVLLLLKCLSACRHPGPAVQQATRLFQPCWAVQQAA